VKKLRYLNPFKIRDAVREIRRVVGGGGPTLVRLVGIDRPAGWFLPTATVTIEVEGRDGRRERFCPEFPVPFPYAWAWRIARRLGVPLVREKDARRLSFELPVPGRSR
jgi:hypothetical protein